MNILVIEDHQLVREMLSMSCRHLLPDATLHGAPSGQDGLRLAQALQPELVFLDVVLPDGEGFDLVARLRSAVPGVKIIILSSQANEFSLHRVLQENVEGFIDKNEQPLHLLKVAIEAVMSGKRYYSASIERLRASLRADPHAFSKLFSPREVEMLRLFGEGLSNEDIGSRYQLSPGTVKNHRRNIMAKLEIRSTPELIRYAIEKGFTHIRDVSATRS